MHKIGKIIGTCTYEVVDGRARLASDEHFKSLTSAVRDGSATQKFPKGTLLFDVWRDTALGITYEIPWVIASYRQVTLEDGTQKPGAVLMWNYVAPFGVTMLSAPLYDDTEMLPSASNIHQFLNSSAGKGEWWLPQSESAEANDIIHEKDGFMKGCTTALLSAISKVKIQTITSANEVHECSCYFFLPSCTEMNCAQPYNSQCKFANSDIEGEPFELFRTTEPTSFACPERVFTDIYGNNHKFWLRSMEIAFCPGILGWCIKEDGSLDDDTLCYNYRFVPTCVIT